MRSNGLQSSAPTHEFRNMMKTMDSFARLGAHRSHSHCYGEDVQRRMVDEDAFSCFEICGSEYWYPA